MAGGIVGVTPSVYAVLDPLRPVVFADSAEEQLGCHQSMFILVHVWSPLSGNRWINTVLSAVGSSAQGHKRRFREVCGTVCYRGQSVLPRFSEIKRSMRTLD